MSNSQHSTNHLYNSVIDRVIKSLTATFYDNNVPYEVLQEIKEIWKKKIEESGAVTDFEKEEPAHLDEEMNGNKRRR
jgi:hypothetical protein